MSVPGQNPTPTEPSSVVVKTNIGPAGGGVSPQEPSDETPSNPIIAWISSLAESVHRKGLWWFFLLLLLLAIIALELRRRSRTKANKKGGTKLP